MKKLMVAFAAVAMAIAANATTVQWGLLSGKLDDTKIDAGTFYLVTGTMDWTKLEGMSEFTVASLYTCGATDVWDSFEYSSTTINGSKLIKPTDLGPDSEVAIGGGSKSFTYVCIDDGGKNIAYSSKNVNITTSTMAMNSKVLESTFTYATAEAIPEPTSGLLMLLGMAGLALRRRRA